MATKPNQKAVKKPVTKVAVKKPATKEVVVSKNVPTNKALIAQMGQALLANAAG